MLEKVSDISAKKHAPAYLHGKKKQVIKLYTKVDRNDDLRKHKHTVGLLYNVIGSSTIKRIK